MRPKGHTNEIIYDSTNLLHFGIYGIERNIITLFYS